MALAAKEKPLTGTEKAAVLLITLGPEKSAQVFRHLKEDEIETLSLQIAGTSAVKPETKEEILQEFYEICLAQQYVTEGGLVYAREILEKALGQAKAQEIIGKLNLSLQARPFSFVRKTDATQILTFIQNEHPQVIALILSYLTPGQAAQIMIELSPEKQADVARRIAKMERTSPDVIKEIERTLEKKLSSLSTEDYAVVGGVDSIVDILNSVDRATEKNIMETLGAEDLELSEEIKKKMFVFEDITMLASRDIQQVFRQEVDDRDISVALKSANENVIEAVLGNMSKRRAAMIREEMEYLGPVRKSDVEDAQQKIVNIIRKLQDSGEILIARGGGDDIIV